MEALWYVEFVEPVEIPSQSRVACGHDKAISSKNDNNQVRSVVTTSLKSVSSRGCMSRSPERVEGQASDFEKS